MLTHLQDMYVSAVAYARVNGSNQGSYTVERRNAETGGLESETVHVARVLDTWRIVGCCDTKTYDCYECHELFSALNGSGDL